MMTKIPHNYSINGIKLCTIEMDEKVVPFTREELQKRIENPTQHDFVSIYDLLAGLINEINQLRDELAECSNK